MFDEVASLFSEGTELIMAEIGLLRRLLKVLIPLLILETVMLVFLLLMLFLLLRLAGCLADHNRDKQRISVGIFHPYSQAGGGGERVLWCAIKTLQNRYPHVDIIVYTADADTAHATLQAQVRDRFNIVLPRPVRLVRLVTRPLLEAWLYPRFTMILQAVGSVFVGLEALVRYRPDVFLDTMGYSFINPLIKVMVGGSCKIACYIHYPIISTDMLTVVENQDEAHNNAGFIARSGILSTCKYYYYKTFATAYGYVGRQADLIMVNSSWTSDHIKSIWGIADQVQLVFPPCDIAKFTSLDILPYEEKLMKKIVSIGQFRPEKDHELQLRSFKRLLELVTDCGGDIEALEVQLVIVGGVRGVEDQRRVSRLQDLAVELEIQNQVDWQVNMPFDELTTLLQESCVGLHTMWNEHFGISIVEMQAAGLITVAHDSAGPKMDIVVPYEDSLTGLLASDVVSYAESMHTALTMCDADRANMQRAARKSAARFSDETFEEKFGVAMDQIMPPIPAFQN